jgi:hypothetical protein
MFVNKLDAKYEELSFSFGLSDHQDEEGLYNFASPTHENDEGLLEGRTSLRILGNMVTI